jgi:hypothetical protein
MYRPGQPLRVFTTNNNNSRKAMEVLRYNDLTDTHTFDGGIGGSSDAPDPLLSYPCPRLRDTIPAQDMNQKLPTSDDTQVRCGGFSTFFSRVSFPRVIHHLGTHA